MTIRTDPRVDGVTRGVSGIFEHAFPDRIRGVYLRGSHASGTVTAGSDLDMFVVFKDTFVDSGEAARAQKVCEHCALLSPILLEIIVISEGGLQRDDNVVVALQLKLASRLVHGDDTRGELPEMRVEAYVREVVHTPYYSYRYPAVRRRNHALTYPLHHIDDAEPCLGYDEMLMPGPDGTDVPSTKLLVASVGWTATAIIASQTGLYVRDKSDCVELYREHIADEWTDLVVDVHELCRNRWEYRVPTADSDRLTLQILCERALAFQNHYLGRYRCYLLAELRSGTPDRQLLATRRLRDIVFPDQQVDDALRELLLAGDAEVRQEAKVTLNSYGATSSRPRQP